MATQTAKPLSPAEEHGSKFHPSENFKDMKKYLKWKFENSTINASNDSPQVTTTTPSSSAHVEGKVKPLKVVQPPLPPYSPPPGVYIKQEIDTIDYQDREPEPCVDSSQPDTVLNTSIAAPKETMCRNFVRGTCKNEYTCKFVHKIIKEQLKYVYTFCKEFQNKGCTRPRCGYVHCTVFEQEQFYRTGQLPPHATEHIKQHKQQIQRTMLPEDKLHIPPQIVHQPSMNMAFDMCSTMVPVGSTPPKTERTDSTDYGQGYGQGVYQYESACSTSSNKRPWTCDTAYSQRDLDFREPPLKKCKDCDANEFRCEFYKNKAKDLIIAAAADDQKLAQLRKKTQRLMEILEFVGQPVFYKEYKSKLLKEDSENKKQKSDLQGGG